MLMNSVEPEKWYTVVEVETITGWSGDTVRRWVKRGLLQAFVQPAEKRRGKRVYQCIRILGSELLRFIRENLS